MVNEGMGGFDGGTEVIGDGGTCCVEQALGG
jgi:hypothetical protein